MSDRIEAEILDVFGEEVAAEVGTPFVVIEGSKGDPGKDGHSPVVTATKSGKTTTISVDGAAIATVEDGADGAQGKDGADGSNGKDGVSPTVSTAATTGGTKVTITDAKGSHEFVVKDGAKGADGSNGKDGTNGKDGADGKPGAAGADGITPHIGGNGNWYLGDTDTGVSAGGGTADAVLYTAQTLTDPQQGQARKNIGALGHNSPQVQGYMTLTPANETLGHGVGLSPSGSGYDYTLDISEVDTQEPTKLIGVKTPTDADTNAAATVEYVEAKVASGGITPTIGDNGNWYFGTTDTGKPSRGATGAPGKDGAKGDPGTPGTPGTPGKDGHSPVVTATKSGKTTTISVDGAAIATVEDGTDGAPGKDGADGKPGAPGKDGAGMDITGATVGQIAKITAVDASGVPTAWSPADMPSGGSSFTDDGAGNISVDGAAAQSVNRFLQSMTFPGLNFKYLNPMNSGTYSDPYGIKVGSGASLVDTILTKTVPGVYTVYMNRSATDVPEAAAAASSSLRGLVILSQIKKHYAIILLVDQSSNFYVQYIQNDVGGGWKRMPDSSASAEAVLYTTQTLTDAQKKQARENVDAASDFVVNGTVNSDMSVALDKTFAQIQAAISAGKTPIVTAGNLYLRLAEAADGHIVFTAATGDKNVAYIPTLFVYPSQSPELTQIALPGFNSDGNMPQLSMASAPTKDMQIATKKYVDDNKTDDAVLYTEQALTEAQQGQARKNIGALPSEEPIIKGGAFTLDTPGAQIRAQLDGYLTSETGEDFANIGFASTHPDATNDHIVISGLANFGDAEMVGLEDTAVSYAQLTNYTKPLMLTYDNNKVTGASYYEIRKAIERGRQIKLAVANSPDIIAANAKNETDKSVLEFTDTEVGGDTVFIQQYNVTAQASGLTVAVKSIELP